MQFTVKAFTVFAPYITVRYTTMYVCLVLRICTAPGDLCA